MWWMGAFYAVYLVFLLVEVWSMFTDHPRVHRYACLASSCTAVLAPATLGAVFAVVFSRTYWYGMFTPITMLVTALLAGSALLGIVFTLVVRFKLAGFERAERLAIPAIRILLAVGLVGSLVFAGRAVFDGLTSDDGAFHAATAALVSGPLAVPFWGRFAIGLAVPLLLIALPRTRTVLGTGIAAGLAFTGVFVDRLLFVTAGQIIPTTAVGGVVSDGYVAYVPSLVEISIVIGALAFVAFVYTLAERYLDLREADIHFGFHVPDVRVRCADSLPPDTRRRQRRRSPRNPSEAVPDASLLRAPRLLDRGRDDVRRDPRPWRGDGHRDRHPGARAGPGSSARPPRPSRAPQRPQSRPPAPRS